MAVGGNKTKVAISSDHLKIEQRPRNISAKHKISSKTEAVDFPLQHWILKEQILIKNFAVIYLPDIYDYSFLPYNRKQTSDNHQICPKSETIKFLADKI